MQRDMSYALDGAFSTRNQGQLMTLAKVQTKAMRTPGLLPAGRKNNPRALKGAGMGARKYGPGMGSRAPGMAGFAVELPFFGELKWSQLALGAGLGLLVWKLTAGKRDSAKKQIARALAS